MSGVVHCQSGGDSEQHLELSLKTSQKPRRADREEGFDGEPPEVGEASSVDEGGSNGAEREEGDSQVDLLEDYLKKRE